MYRLIIVDDEAEIRNGLTSFFPWEELGFTVLQSFENGLEALDYVRENPVDAVLCDVVMPRMNGLELTQALRDLHYDGKIVFLSGHRNFEYAQKAMELGVRNYVVKPCRYNQLTEVFTKIKDELDRNPPESPEEALPVSMDDRNMVKAIKKYLGENYRTTGLYDTAAQMHMNPHYLSRYFKYHTGVNFVDYLLEIKMKKAAELFGDVTLKTYEISSLVGYATPKSFTRAFKKYYGYTPRQFRNGEGDAQGEEGGDEKEKPDLPH